MYVYGHFPNTFITACEFVGRMIERVRTLLHEYKTNSFLLLKIRKIHNNAFLF